MKLIFGNKKKVIVIMAFLFLLVINVPLVSALSDENIWENINIWKITTSPWTNLFEPVSHLFWVLMLSVTTLGVYMKTHSVGSVVVVLTVFGLLLVDLVPGPGAWIFRVFISVAAGVLLYILYKGRS